MAAWIGAAVQAAGSLFGGVTSALANRKRRKRLNAQLKDNQAWYDRRMNEDATQRADAQRMLTLTEESIKNRNRAAAGTQSVMGGTDESTAATKSANNQALSQTASAIAANGDARKDYIESQYHQNRANIEGQLNGLDAEKVQNIATATKGVASAAGNFINAYSKDAEDDKGQKEATGGTNVTLKH